MSFSWSVSPFQVFLAPHSGLLILDNERSVPIEKESWLILQHAEYTSIIIYHLDAETLLFREK
jgi:hypothetical protein